MSAAQFAQTQVAMALAPFPETLWVGTDHSLEIAIHAHSQMSMAVFDRSQQTQPEDEVPYNYSLQGDVGVISIRGPLVNNDSRYNKYHGVTSYSDIREAAVYASKDPGAKAILLDIHSGGGALSGLTETGQLLSMIDSKVKPVFSYTGGTMASAAYWLGVSGRAVYTSEAAIMGSIGVIVTHREYSKMLEAAGITTTVMRAGKFKALVNSDEPLSKLAQEQEQAKLDSAMALFTRHIADRRGTTAENVDKQMGQGREFFGAAAVSAGLADGVETFDGVISKISAQVLDNNQPSNNNSGNFLRGSNMKTALTEQQIAAMAGIDANQAAASTAEATAAAEAAAAAAAAGQASSAAAASASTQMTQSQNEQSGEAVLAFLRGELREAQASSAKASADLAQAQASLAQAQAANASLSKIVASSVTQMKVALGLTAMDLSSLTPEALLAEHTATAAVFVKQLPVGGVAAVTQSTEQAEVSALGPNFRGRVAATRATSK